MSTSDSATAAVAESLARQWLYRRGIDPDTIDDLDGLTAACMELAAMILPVITERELAATNRAATTIRAQCVLAGRIWRANTAEATIAYGRGLTEGADIAASMIVVPRASQESEVVAHVG